jgi:adenylate cyclase class 2
MKRGMSYEVEQKFRISDPADIERRLAALGAAFAPAVEQVDQYFGHPVRDFGRSDEALRLRRIGEQNRVTYKGPKLDQVTKTRREIEIGFSSGATAAGQFAELLQALGFRPVLEVRKQRRIAHLHWRGEEAEVALDHVARLGDFVEIEIAAGEDRLEAATESLLTLAEDLGLTASERRSYLELLLALADA